LFKFNANLEGNKQLIADFNMVEFASLS